MTCGERERWLWRWDALLGTLWLLSLASCGAGPERASRGSEPSGPAAPGPRDQGVCPARAPAPAQLPNTPPELETLGYWLGLGDPNLDESLLDEAELAAHDLALRRDADGAVRFLDMTRDPSRDEIAQELSNRFARWRARVTSGEYTAQRPLALAELPHDASTALVESRELRVALEPVALRCAPYEQAVRSTKDNPRFDRNSCSRARPQEALEIVGKLGTRLLARTRHALGFIAADAALSPPVPKELAPLYRGGRELELLRDLVHGGQRVPAGTLLPLADDGAAYVASPTGFARVLALDPSQARPTLKPLTRRAFLTEAFRYLGAPYGWGDEGGGRDCSRFVLDVFQRFGLHLPRVSSDQSRAGLYSIEVPPEASETERLALLTAAHEHGVVLMHFPGHVMLYLGRDHEGVPRALHAFAEYLAPCPGGGETLFEVGRVGVTDLSLGRGTTRRAFVERITRLSVLGKPGAQALLALSRFRPPVPPTGQVPSRCRDSLDVSLFRSPRAPHAGAPLRVIAVSQADTRPAGLWLIDPDGQLVSSAPHELGVGPFGRWVELPEPRPGTWTALVADAERVLACERFRVAAKPERVPVTRESEAPVWAARLRWERDTEHLYAAFVEQLFSHPLSDVRSWSSLSELLVNPERNLLFGHLGLDEDARLKLSPDCADLPYFLRAYFAWKLGLPFGFRPCSRGRAGAPPRCGELRTNELLVSARDEVEAFQRFVREHVGAGVHSASGRTLPQDDATDLYPLPLTRQALRPGSVFADPYGHMIVVAKWVPQGLFGQGMLLGADAQPDATVGRRRFWRGNFLFTPATRDVGAGFKAFRPIVRDPANKALIALDARALAAAPDHAPASLVQYEGSVEDFYARMDELIYPRPIAATDRMRQVVDALEEQVRRRVEAIDVGEAFVTTRAQPIAMPDGYAIFETEGAWEDYATPSRDMRLLIAIDTVRGFPAYVRAQPARFGVLGADAQSFSKQVEQLLASALKARRFAYTRSDGSRFELTLDQVLARAEALEAAYNPNDCVEARWGAAPGSDEHEPCRRAAPAPQKTLMERYRSWFHTRTRPPRP